MDWVEKYSNEIITTSAALGVGGILASFFLPPATLAILGVQAAINSTAFFFATMMGSSFAPNDQGKIFATDSRKLFSSFISATAVAITTLIGISQPITMIIGLGMLLITGIIPYTYEQIVKEKKEKQNLKRMIAANKELLNTTQKHIDRLTELKKVRVELTDELLSHSQQLTLFKTKNPHLFKTHSSYSSTSKSTSITAEMSQRTAEMSNTLCELFDSYPITNEANTLPEIEQLLSDRIEHMEKIEELYLLLFNDTNLRIGLAKQTQQKFEDSITVKCS